MNQQNTRNRRGWQMEDLIPPNMTVPRQVVKFEPGAVIRCEKQSLLFRFCKYIKELFT
jgi:hypothetical protein